MHEQRDGRRDTVLIGTFLVIEMIFIMTTFLFSLLANGFFSTVSFRSWLGMLPVAGLKVVHGHTTVPGRTFMVLWHVYSGGIHREYTHQSEIEMPSQRLQES